MRPLLLTLLIFVAVGVSCAQTVTVRKETIKLLGLENPHKCSGGPRGPHPNTVILDDTHLLISNGLTCRMGRPGDYQVAVADLHGKILATSHSDEPAYVGPDGQLIINHLNGPLEILNQQLMHVADIPFTYPNGNEIFLTPSRNAFSMCSTLNKPDSSYMCKLFGGNPPVAKMELNTHGPFPGLTSYGFAVLPPGIASQSGEFYHPVSNETWFFRKDNRLTKVSSDGAETELPGARWLTIRKYDECKGGMSAREPRRFLAYCSGDLDLLGGDEMPIYPYQRVIVYSLEGHILFKKSISANGEVSISPSGRLVAVSHGTSVDLYHLP